MISNLKRAVTMVMVTATATVMATAMVTEKPIKKLKEIGLADCFQKAKPNFSQKRILSV